MPLIRATLGGYLPLGLFFIDAGRERKEVNLEKKGFLKQNKQQANVSDFSDLFPLSLISSFILFFETVSKSNTSVFMRNPQNF